MSFLVAETGDRLQKESADGDLLIDPEILSARPFYTRWSQKPPPGTQLDFTHPHCPDHCWAFLSPQGTATPTLGKGGPLLPPTTRGDIYAGSCSIVPGAGKYGLSVRHGATNDLTALTASDLTEVSKVLPTGGGFTALIAYRKTDATSRVNSAFGCFSSGVATERCDAYIDYNDGNTYFMFGGTTVGTTAVSVANAGLTFGDDLWVMSTGPRGMEIWQNGILRASNAANPTRTNGFAGNYFALNAFTPPISDLSDTALLMTWRRQLDTAAIRALSVNPWQVFQPRASIWTASDALFDEGIDLPMPALSIRRWNQKPPMGVGLDTTFPLCPDFCWPFLSPQGTLQVLTKKRRVGAVASQIISNGAWAMTRRFGPAVRHTVNTDILNFCAVDVAEVDHILVPGTPAGPTTVLIGYRSNGGTTTGGGSTWGVDTGVGNQAWFTTIPWTNGQVLFSIGDTAVAPTLGFTPSSLGENIWAFVNGPRGMEIWQDGILKASQTNIPNRVSTPTVLKWPS